MRVVRWTGAVLLALAIGLGAVAFGARFADGPLGILPGGPFQTGPFVEDPVVDWSFAREVREIELQSGDPPRSRTTWLLVEGGEAYVPCSLDFPPGKRWHREALRDPSAVVRVAGRRFRRRLERVEDPALRARLVEQARVKYGGGPVSDASRVWFFHLAPPEGGARSR